MNLSSYLNFTISRCIENSDFRHMGTRGDRTEPPFFELLSPLDKQRYFELRDSLLDSDKRYKKNMRIESLQEALTAVKSYCLRGDENDWKRCLVAGICWLSPYDIAVNTRQLRLLLNKCKSSINGALSKMNYSTITGKNVATTALLKYIPYLQGNFVEQRQWTLRRQFHASPYVGVSWGHRANATPFTPQPEAIVPPSDPEPPVNDVEAVFGVQTKQKEDQGEYNFITDPVCCCPVAWGKDESEIEDFFLFA